MLNKSSLAGCIAVLLTGHASAAGFQVAEHSASGLGRAFSGEAAVADNASVLARNPAAMMRFKTAQFSGALSIVDPEVNVDDLSNHQSMKDVAPLQIVPAAYYISPINDQWAWGFAMFTTYGVATDYPDDIYAGDLAGDTSLISINLNPNIAYRVNPELSVGFGLDLVVAKAELTRHKGGLAPFMGDGKPSDKLIGMKGDTVALGWNIGAMYEFDQQNRIGLGYRSRVKLNFDDGEFSSYDTGIATSAVVPGQLKIELPAIFELSGFHQLNDQWAVHYSYQHTDWSSFKELTATSNQCKSGTCFQKIEQYENNRRWSAGATYTANSTWTLRAGLAFDEQAGEATLSIPDSDRFWYSAGFTYTINPQLTMDAGFALVQSRNGSFTEQNQIGQNLKFKSEAIAYISALQFNYRFN
ncbi:long-chain fatty acid transporter [Vibrio sp. V27_P1S3P104]|uniref:outer membrane protein transport protein n=2 Tax=Vibrio TaxID=662 RepID=UPI001372F448|nr:MULTISPECIES: outer membrane protein transport protein [unclassified Vibrio]NAW68055.1 long-chain fatty acid transporter [Vibrio sp. V28_P6S34P95]NAX04140.1 long-chain fatty acid transporter [Vibrio sp. V30_P3S12P165]NAX35530.1 long-chain fatty acid transporter [Vibrio sp. V29_P1S30P107]NAX37320.1 long-chain fatty acid transporter [Vibrio sp. V27_P1S3P104]NAX39331.1 long-chain fatty acid transporter [Vibrio sp. V26_P1S5P106]